MKFPGYAVQFWLIFKEYILTIFIQFKEEDYKTESVSEEIQYIKLFY